MASQRACRPVLAAVAVGVVALGGLGTSEVNAQLPDNRAYELVSPPAKNGADVVAQTSKTHAAAAGGAVTFSSLTGFGDIRGTSVDAEYLSERTAAPGTNGWVTHAISPRESSLTVSAVITGNVPGYQFITDGLEDGVYLSWRPLTSAPNADGVSNFYLRKQLRSGNGTTQLLTDSVAPPPPLPLNFMLLLAPRFAAASADASHVIFESQLGLTPDAAFGLGAFKLYENANGVVRLVGRVPAAPVTECDDVSGPACDPAPTSQAGVQASNFFYSQDMISDDGSRIFFQTPSSLSGGSVYVREDGRKTVQLNASEKTTPEAPAAAQLWAASADGARAFFITPEGLVDGDDDGSNDLYMSSVEAPPGRRLTLVSEDGETDDADSVGSVVGVSDDGGYVYFVSSGQLVADEPLNRVAGLYVWHEGAMSFIGEFADVLEATQNGPQGAQTTWRVDRRTNTARISPDGRHLLFMTHTDRGFRGRGGFAGYDHGTTCTYDQPECRQLYIYSADTGRLRCASCNPSGRTGTFDALTDLRAGAGGAAITPHLSQALSDDGRRVFFTTGEALVPQDANGKRDAYMYDVVDEAIHLISSGKDDSDSYFLDASDDGRDVFFTTRERLVGWDMDDNYDLYDARVGGGLPEPQVAAQDCVGEACLAQPGPKPAIDSAASRPFQGAGNADERFRRRCGPRTVLKTIRGKRRCVRVPRRCARKTVARIIRGRRTCIRVRLHGSTARHTGATERSGK